MKFTLNSQNISSVIDRDAPVQISIWTLGALNTVAFL